MTMKEIVDALLLPPLFFKDFAIVAVVLSIIQISPLNLNPWKWLKSFAELPGRVEEIENAFERYKAHRWRTEILHYADAIRRGQEFSKETWDDIIDSIDHYNLYCKMHEDFRNGKTTAATLFLNNYYAEALETPGKFLD